MISVLLVFPVFLVISVLLVFLVISVLLVFPVLVFPGVSGDFSVAWCFQCC